jgi:hypothetical protein
LLALEAALQFNGVIYRKQYIEYTLGMMKGINEPQSRAFAEFVKDKMDSLTLEELRQHTQPINTGGKLGKAEKIQRKDKCGTRSVGEDVDTGNADVINKDEEVEGREEAQDDEVGGG